MDDVTVPVGRPRPEDELLDRHADYSVKEGTIETAEWCVTCGAEIGPGDTVHLKQKGRSGKCPVTLPVCAACYRPARWATEWVFICRYCGRQVIGDKRYIYGRRTCSGRCARLLRRGPSPAP